MDKIIKIMKIGGSMERNVFLRHLDETCNQDDINFYDITLLEQNGIAEISSLPFTIKILVENLLRNLDGKNVKEEDLLKIANWKPRYDKPVEIPFHPGRVLMQDFTGVPAVVDLAAMRDAVSKFGGNPEIINPMIPVELIIDHSMQLDSTGSKDSLKINVDKEYKRNTERYTLLKWAQKSFKNFNVVPPNSGICHQVNLEHLGRVIMTDEKSNKKIAFPDTVVGTDSHTTMINGIGVLGWGVGGIEAEAVMLGQPYYMSIPQVVGVRLVGKLNDGITATDLVLSVVQILRKHNVVEKFVEFFGSGYKNLSVTDRATLSNMAPEYGATVGFCPVDEKTIDYLKMTGRDKEANLVESCTKALGLFYTGETEANFSEIIEINLCDIQFAVAGPSRPQDKILLSKLKPAFADIIKDADQSAKQIKINNDKINNDKINNDKINNDKKFSVEVKGEKKQIGNGSVVIASITSCTNTSNPSVMMGAGILAKKAVEMGLKVPSYVKTSLVPGSKVVVDYLEDANLMQGFESLGFNVVGFGCGTCIGNSGPLLGNTEDVISENGLNVASVVSGNRNFEARIHQAIKSNFLASPMLVVAFAIAGRIDIDLTSEPIGIGIDKKAVFFKDIMPTTKEINQFIEKHVKKKFFLKEYKTIFEGDKKWQDIVVEETSTFNWDKTSTYIRNPPFFENFNLNLTPLVDIKSARPLMVLGDSVTTDHISPAGAIPSNYPAGQYLAQQNISSSEFNSYGSRRGNHEVMMRGTFANIRIKNSLVTPKEGGLTLKFPSNKEMFVFDASTDYRKEQTNLIILGGKEYGTGSSRDWAAKGTDLLGVKAVIVESFERIHRSNLVGMGVLPLVFRNGENKDTLGLKGFERYTISKISEITPRCILQVMAEKVDNSKILFDVIVRLDTDIEIEYFKNGGILPFVLRKFCILK